MLCIAVLTKYNMIKDYIWKWIHFFQTKTTRHKTTHGRTTLHKTTRQKYASQMSSLPHILPHNFFTAPYLPHILPIFDAPYSKNWKVESLEQMYDYRNDTYSSNSNIKINCIKHWNSLPFDIKSLPYLSSKETIYKNIKTLS